MCNIYCNGLCDGGCDPSQTKPKEYKVHEWKTVRDKDGELKILKIK